MNKIVKYFVSIIVSSLAVIWIIYAANITWLGQTAVTGDKITATWVNAVNSKLNNFNSWINIYQCPSWKTPWANPGGGAWWSYWCQWQISSISTCNNVEFPWSENRSCTLLWKIVIAP